MSRIIRLIADGSKGPVVDVRANGKMDGQWLATDLVAALRLLEEYPDYISPPRKNKNGVAVAIVAVIEDKGFGSPPLITFKLATCLGSKAFRTMPLAQAATSNPETLRNELKQAAQDYFEKNREAAQWVKIAGILEYFRGPPLSPAGT